MDFDDLFYLTKGSIWAKKNIHSVYFQMSSDLSKTLGFKQKESAIGVTDDELPCAAAEFAEIFRKQDQQVIQDKKILKIIDIHPYASRKWTIYLTVKSPLINKKNEIIGVFVYSIDMSNSLGKMFSALFNIDYSTNTKSLQNSYYINSQDKNFILTPRQTEYLFYLLRGKSTKQIAQFMCISPRTAEDYLERLKFIFFSQTKSELIEHAIYLGFLQVIPENIVHQQLSQVIEMMPFQKESDDDRFSVNDKTKEP